MTDDRADEWGPWIEHDGNGCPLNVMGKLVEVYWRPEVENDLNWRHGVFLVDDLNASCSSWHASKYEGRGMFQHWNGETFPNGPHWIDRYRIRKPRALQHLINIAAHVPNTAPRELEDV